MSPQKYCNDIIEDVYRSKKNCSRDNNVANGNLSVKPSTFQRGVLRTNCIDCLDRTNVAQYAYGLAALGSQLHALGIKDSPKLDLNDPLADELMSFYERMGDTLAHQYGGSAAHNKIFSQRRGQWRAATQSQEFFRTLQRYYSNAYIDAEKQNAINVFLGYYQPQPGKPAVWELGSYQHYKGRNGETIVDDDGRSLFKRSFSDGNILWPSVSPESAKNGKQEKSLNSNLPGLSESSPDISTCESDISYSRYTPLMPPRQLFGDMHRDCCLETGRLFFSERGDGFNCSNFVDLDCLSSSGNSCEDEPSDRSTSSSHAGLSSEIVVNGVLGEATPSSSEYGSSMKGRQQTGTELSSTNSQSNVLEEFSDSFVQWVHSGAMLCY